MRKKNLEKSAIQEKKGVKQQPSTFAKSIKKVPKKRSEQPTIDDFVSEILKGNTTFLSRAITLVESTNPKHTEKANAIITKCLPYAGNSIRIGITGVPGVGKSTFIEAFGKKFTEKGNKLAVLAIDPSSSINKGSILGDKTRMSELVKDQNAFIRPSPSGESLGGVAKKTRETIILCEAAGFNVIFIETVGVGQSETTVHSMVDFFLLLKLAGAGDELQGIKRGIIEMADTIVINKADNNNVQNALNAKIEFSKALHLYPPKTNNWHPKVLTCSALNGTGIEEIYQTILDYIELTKKNNYFEQKRTEQNQFWLIETINEHLKNNFYSQKEVKQAIKTFSEAIKNAKTTPFNAAEEILKLAKK